MRKYLTLTLNGNHHSVGQQHGWAVKKLRPLIAEAIETRLDELEQDGPDARFETLVRETREAMEVYSPPTMDLIRGQAKALEFDFDILLRYNLVTFLRDELVIRKHTGGGCTTWAATGAATASGQPVLAKNRDSRPQHISLQIVVRTRPESGYRHVDVGSAGSPGVFSAGINETGLAVADTHVHSTDLGPGLPTYALMMHILEEHSDVSSAIDYLRSVPRLGRNNLILADAHGHVAVFESGHSRYGLFEIHDGTLVNANHFVSSQLRDCFVELNPPEMKGNSVQRYEKATRELDAALGRIDVPFAQRLMATHDGPLPSICRHPKANRKTATISASVFSPSQRTMLFCHGLPCQGRYDAFSV
ncbi:MAG: C45 family autoproteolytic acyltransferase/hydrolase [Anaerolineae bacterium]|jgi:predicted choloylglycine hydrolase